METRFSHGYLIYGDMEKAAARAREMSEEILGVENLSSHQDFFQENYNLFGIDESRELKNRAYIKPIAGDKKVFIINSPTFTGEAQNALLKLFEEPPIGAHFFVIAPNAENFLPTLRSRLILINVGQMKIDDKSREEARQFLADNPAKRLATVKKIVEALAFTPSGRGGRGKKDKNEALEFLNSLEVAMAAVAADQNVRHRVTHILEAREYLKARGSSTRLVLEHLALVLPISS